MPKRRRDLSVPSDSVPILNEKLGQLSSITQRLTNDGLLDADAVSGVLAEIVGGTGESAYVDGQLLVGNGTTKGLDKTTLTAGNNITITNGPGSVVIAAVSGSGLGDVVGPASATANAIPIFNGTTGKIIKDSLKAVPSGAIVGTTDSQTLSSKALTTPTIGDFSNATHAHQNAAGGGTLDAAAMASGQLALARGGSGSDLSATGGTHQVLRQSSLGAAVTVSQLAAADVSGLAASATTDATNASNITTGTLPAGRLPNPSATTLGGIESAAAVSHQWIDSVSTSGVPHLSQPAFTDVSGSVATGQMPALTGDITTSAGAVATTLAAVSSTSGTTGDASHVAQVTTNAKGLVTAQSSVAIVITPTAAGLSNVTNDAQTKAAVVPNTAPSSGQILVGNAGGTAYAPQSMSSDATIASTGALTIAANAVTDAKFRQSGALAVVGRSANSTGNTADIQATAASGAVLRESGSVLGFGTIATAGIAANAVTLAKMDATNGTANRVLMSGASASPTWSTPTFPNASATSGKTIRSDGTNWTASTATLSDAPSTAGKILVSDGTNWITSTPTYPNASATAGKIIRSDGTNFVATTATYPATTTANQILYSSAANTVAEITAAARSILVTDASNVPGLVSTAWLTRTFAAGNYTGSGSMTWTVSSGNVTTDAYLLIGKLMIYAFNIAGTSVGGTPSSVLQIKLPASVTANRTIDSIIRISDSGATSVAGWAEVAAAGTVLLILKMDGSNWFASTSSTTVMGQITFEVQ